MRFFVLLVLFFSIGYSLDRPKVALVLSGGGARGGAHVGVLKVLEENKVPIDMIVGTSMGSFVGALYASGRSPEYIETLLVSTDWKKHITTDFNRADAPMRKKAIDYIYQGRMGVGLDKDYDLVLPTGVLKRQPMLLKFLKETQHVEDINNFDKLSIPYRAIATDIKNGEEVVLKSGSLAKAIYASSSIPGGFQPINIDGVDLVDGGVSTNIPIHVAREMGADIIITVDVSENFEQELDVNSYLVVMGQLVNILMRKNANESLETLSENDILLTPELEGISGLDADKYKKIIKAGVKVSIQNVDKLKKLSLSDEKYEEYKKRYRVQSLHKAPIIDKIEIKNETYLSDEAIKARLHITLGEPLDEERLRADLLHLYNMMIFDSVMYDIKEFDGKNTLVISATPSWDSNGELRFALGIEDDFNGHSAYTLKFGFTLFGLSEYGLEWKNDFEIGKEKKAYSELFLPLDKMQRYYIKPSVEFNELNDLVPGATLGLETSGSIELTSQRYGGSLGFGAHVTTNYEFEFGISTFKDELLLELISPLPVKYNALPIYASFKSDSLDNINFPTTGFKSEISWTKEMRTWGSDYDYEQFFISIEKPLTIYANNLTTYFKYGNTYNVDGVTALAGSYTLGGLFNLSGYSPYSLNDDNMVLGIVKYRYQIKDGGFFGALNTPIFAGFSLEAGDTWGKNHDLSYESVKKSATIYFAVDTFLGPFYLAYGHTDTGEHSGYLYLGEKF